MEKNALDILKELVLSAVHEAGFEISEDGIQLEVPKTLEHGHLSSNVALILAKKLQKSPREVAEHIKQYLKSEVIEKSEIAGPGFLNLWLKPSFYTQAVQAFLKGSDQPTLQTQKKVMLIDYSHPNIAKPMGVHHLLSTIIGDAIKKIYRGIGWTVVADNFIGDMGTQFGKLMHAIKTWGNWELIEQNPIQELQKLYVQFHMEADKDVELDEDARAEYKKFESGDPEARQMWEKIRSWSLKEIQPLYDRLDVKFDVMNGESFYEDKMQPILEEGRAKGVIVEGEKGAWIIPADEPEGTPALLRKSDGTTLYATRDLARIQYWEKTWHPDLMLTVVDAAQSFHFQQVFFAAEKLQLTSAKNVHVAFGRMQFKDQKMSTRKGNILLLTQVLDEAQNRALALVKEKGGDLEVREMEALAEMMGINSIKYNILSQNRTTNITFDWDKMLSFEGNSAPYLMYTLARAKSVLRKAEIDLDQLQGLQFHFVLDQEQRLVLQLLQYSEVLHRAAEEFKPNHLANYLYQLASDFNAFYNGNSILKAETSALLESRLLMTASLIKVMEKGFELLGMEPPEKM